MSVHVCGATASPPAPPAHFSEDGKRAWSDRWLYHNPDGRYRSTVGIPMELADGTIEYGCVGCWWCSGPVTDAHREMRG